MATDREQVKHIHIPGHIEVRGARVHNLKDLDVDIPLHQIVGIAGVSGSGKSSLALGVLYAEGSRRYLESLSTYTRRRMTQASKAPVDEVRYVPAALALHQRPGVPGIRSTFGTMTELLNGLRLMFSRLSNYRCPNGHIVPPSMAVAAETPFICPECGAEITPIGAEELAFNSGGACPECQGTGVVRTVDEDSLVPDDSLTIDEGAVAPWQSLMWSLMKDMARDQGVRTDVPFRDLTEREKEIVLHGPAEKRHLLYTNEKTNTLAEMDFTYYSAAYTVENALSKVKDEKGMKRVEKFLKETLCPQCHGTQLSERARSLTIMGESLDQVCEKPLSELMEWVGRVPDWVPPAMRPMAESICEAFFHTARRLVDLGLSYLSLDRAASTLSTGERQRTQLARAVRNRTTGVLYVLDEPSIGLHPSNLEGLKGVMDDLVADGNSIVLVDHDTQVLAHADYILELGPEAGAGGGEIIASGSVEELAENKDSRIGPFLAREMTRAAGRLERGTDITAGTGTALQAETKSVAGSIDRGADTVAKAGTGPEVGSGVFSEGEIRLETGPIHTVRPLSVRIPKGKLTVVTGVSGSGKTTLILESLVPGLAAHIEGKTLPEHVLSVEAEGIRQVKLIDATPIGINVRSTVATYANVHDELRKVYARSAAAKAQGYKAGDFSYNTGSLRCPVCDGTGTISLDVQFLPDVDVPCPECGGSRYAKAAYKLLRTRKDGTAMSLPELMEKSVDEALPLCDDLRTVYGRLKVLQDLGLGYLTLAEETPALSGGEAQRLKLASEMGRGQADSVFVFDEPTIGLHPLDVERLMAIFRHLIDLGGTVIVIEHDTDVIRGADYVIDMGPGGGKEGGRIVAQGTPEEIRQTPESVTGRYL